MLEEIFFINVLRLEFGSLFIHCGCFGERAGRKVLNNENGNMLTDSLRSLSNILSNLLSANALIKELPLFRKRKNDFKVKSLISLFHYIRLAMLLRMRNRISLAFAAAPTGSTQNLIYFADSFIHHRPPFIMRHSGPFQMNLH